MIPDGADCENDSLKKRGFGKKKNNCLTKDKGRQRTMREIRRARLLLILSETFNTDRPTLWWTDIL